MPSTESLLEAAIRDVNAGRRDAAKAQCRKAIATRAPHAAVLQLMALLCLQDGELAEACRHIAHSLALRPGHAPSLQIAGDAWFQLALVQQDRREFAAAAESLRCVLRLAPQRAEAEVNLGIVLQEAGDVDAAMSAYGRAYRMRADTFGRIAHALAAAPQGRLWLDLGRLREHLRGAASPA